VVTDLSPEQLVKFARAHPYQRFPVVEAGKPVGILARKELEAALAEKRQPKLDPLVMCLPQETIGQLQSKLIESTSLMVVILDQPGGRVLGLVTFHDMLRAQVLLAREGAT